MTVAQLEPVSPALVRGVRAWDDDYPWLRRAFRQIGPGAVTASDSWRVRIEDELKATLDFKVRPDGTAAVWCGMSGYDFSHDPTPKELLDGLAEAYRRERKRISGATRTGTWKLSTGASTGPRQTIATSGQVSIATPASPETQPPVRTLPPPVDASLPRALGDLLLPRVVQLMVVFVAVTAFTLLLSAVANAVR